MRSEGGSHEPGLEGALTDGGAQSTVAVIVTTFNDAQFLGDALQSIVDQARRPDEIIVVDDGSAVSPAGIVARYPGVRLLRRENRGRSAARNAGVAAASSDFILFLDADDVLLSSAIATGLACFQQNPSAAFVYGGHIKVDQELRPTEEPSINPCGADAFASLLSRNLIGMHAAVLYRREVLVRTGGFDTGLDHCEDYELFLRIAREHAIAWHPEVVALYRHHDGNTSRQVELMLVGAIGALAAHRPGPGEPDERHEAWLSGHAFFRQHYFSTALKALPTDERAGPSLARITRLCRLWSETRPKEVPVGADLRQMARLVWTLAMRRKLARKLPDRIKRRLKRFAGNT